MFFKIPNFMLFSKNRMTLLHRIWDDTGVYNNNNKKNKFDNTRIFKS